MTGVTDKYTVHAKVVENQFADSTPQELSTLAWASAKLSAASKPLMLNLAARASKQIGTFSPQNVAIFSWALAVEHLCDLEVWVDLREFVSARLKEFKRQELSNLCWSFAVVKHQSDCLVVAESLWRGADSDVPGILGLTWALQHLKVSNLGTKAALLRHGAKLDERHGTQLAKCTVPTRSQPSDAAPTISPHIALELFDRLVVSKPAGWEVEDQRDQRDHIHPNLCFYLRSLGQSMPICQDASHHYGFIHRLDVPGSGLVLAAKSYEAFYDLQFQLMSGQVCREYLALCHGFLCQGQQVEYSIRTQQGTPSRVSSGGKPSATHLTPLACCFRTGQTFTLIRVRIVTGRTHQIRAPCHSSEKKKFWQACCKCR